MLIRILQFAIACFPKCRFFSIWVVGSCRNSIYTSGNRNASTVDFFESVFTFSNESIAATRTTRGNWQNADSEPAVQEVAQPSVPRFVPRETVPATVRYPLSRKPTRLENEEDHQTQQDPQLLSDGARPVATFGGTKDVVTTQSANRREKVLVGGRTTSQVSFGATYGQSRLSIVSPSCTL